MSSLVDVSLTRNAGELIQAVNRPKIVSVVGQEAGLTLGCAK